MGQGSREIREWPQDLWQGVEQVLVERGELPFAL
jgi:hypothetical protein